MNYLAGLLSLVFLVSHSNVVLAGTDILDPENPTQIIATDDSTTLVIPEDTSTAVIIDESDTTES